MRDEHLADPGDTSCTIDLPGVASADDCKNDDTTEESDHDLLHHLSASAIESCRGITDLAEPRYYLHVLGFKSPEMETTYLASHSRTCLTGHRIFAAFNAMYLLMRIVKLLLGSNKVEVNPATIYFLCTLGANSAISAFCIFHFSGREMKCRESLARVSNGSVLLAFSGWPAQLWSIVYLQLVDDDRFEPFNLGYFIGVWTSILPPFALVMLRLPFLQCAGCNLAIGVFLLCSSLSNESASSWVFPLLQVPECPQ